MSKYKLAAGGAVALLVLGVAALILARIVSGLFTLAGIALLALALLAGFRYLAARLAGGRAEPSDESDRSDRSDEPIDRAA